MCYIDGQKNKYSARNILVLVLKMAMNVLETFNFSPDLLRKVEVTHEKKISQAQ
jgi:hypothetical protein